MTKFNYRQNEKLNLTAEQLTENEQLVLTALKAADGEPVQAVVLAKACFPGTRSKGETYAGLPREARGYRYVMNSMRRLVAAGFAKKVARGTYVAAEGAPDLTGVTPKPVRVRVKKAKAAKPAAQAPAEQPAEEQKPEPADMPF